MANPQLEDGYIYGVERSISPGVGLHPAYFNREVI